MAGFDVTTEEGEQRWMAIGSIHAATMVVLVVVHTYRESHQTISSALSWLVVQRHIARYIYEKAIK